MASLFFYGTLMAPAVLTRVIGRPGNGLKSSDAILDLHARLHVKGEGELSSPSHVHPISSHYVSDHTDYPAVVLAQTGAVILGRELSQGESSVRGTLVSGLTSQDVAFLDEFEGDVCGSPVPLHQNPR